eukprot:TRINITY_DN13419_c0_g1_i1.p1 TRINITY_DN13419_c0_g1~~TRINITY_DN13419_c0_g1_i1.p1  ORF type:complete len:526 (-),score=62.68 TRINITY_DN13419_c0_g1_i1:69-1646(-)
MSSWQTIKAQGISAYEDGNYAEALDLFTKAIQDATAEECQSKDKGKDKDRDNNKGKDKKIDENPGNEEESSEKEIPHEKQGLQSVDSRGGLSEVDRLDGKIVGCGFLSTLLSLRSSAYFALGLYKEALDDANEAVEYSYQEGSSLGIAYTRKGNALMRLNRYDEALTVFRMASMYGDEEKVKNEISLGWSFADAAVAATSVARRNIKNLVDDLDCVLCMKLLYEPVTTSCGHSFCRLCLIRALDHSTNCPLCRTELHYSKGSSSSQDMPVSVTLATLIERNFPDEYAVRKRETESEEVGGLCNMPLFLLNTFAFPHQSFPMHIFEPRYRLMLRRCMQGSRKFGLVYADRENPSGISIGCTLEIKDVHTVPDGRSYVQTVGGCRFKVLERWVLDGYLCGKVEWYNDCNRENNGELPPSSSRICTPQMQEALAEIRSKLAELVESSSQSSQPLSKALENLISNLGELPTGNTFADAEKFSLLLAAKLHLDPRISMEMLQTRDTLGRLHIELNLLNTSFHQTSNCCVM